MKAKKVIYRDEPFWFRIKTDPFYEHIGSWLRVYEKRQGLLSIIFPLKRVAQYKGGRKEVRDQRTLVKLLAERHMRKGPERPLLIECSKEIQELYEN